VPQVTLAVEGPSGALSQTSLLANVSGNLKSGTLASPTGIVEYWDSVNGGAAQLVATLQLTPGAAGASVAGTRVKLGSGTHSLHARGGFGERNGLQFFVERKPEPAELQGGRGGDGDDYGDAFGRVYGDGEFELPGGRGAGAGWIYVFVQPGTSECEQCEPAIGDDDADADGYGDGGGANRDSARNFLGRSGVMVCCFGGGSVCRLDGTLADSSS
jgi:hypothetical protein